MTTGQVPGVPPAAGNPRPIIDALAAALDDQPGFVKRKDSLAGVAAHLVQLTNLLLVVGADWPLWAHLVIGLIAGAAQVVLTAATPGAFTPSMKGRLLDAWLRAQVERQATTAPAEGEPAPGEPAPGGLPVYDASTTVEVLTDLAREYVPGADRWLGSSQPTQG